MEFPLIPLFSGEATHAALAPILECNAFTAGKYGLALTEQQAVAVLKARDKALSATRRLEFGPSIIDKFIWAICDSPYVTRGNYAETLEELVALFYEYKNETVDRMTDDELIGYMEKCFNGPCQGSIELLGGRELEQMARRIREGHPITCAEEDDEEDEEDEWN